MIILLTAEASNFKLYQLFFSSKNQIISGELSKLVGRFYTLYTLFQDTAEKLNLHSDLSDTIAIFIRHIETIYIHVAYVVNSSFNLNR